MKIIIIFIYIIIFILLINLSINIEKYTNIEINKLDGINMYGGNLTIKTKKNNFNNIKTICIKNQCIDINRLNKLPYQKGIVGKCTKKDCTKICRCPYGTAPEGEDCKVHEKEICISCGKDYKYNIGTKTCVSCEGGKFIDEENHIRTVCCSKTEKYNIDNTCSKKTCQCENGEADNENCEDESLTKCKNCNKNYYLENNECLKCENGIFTQSGNRDRKCCPKGQHYDFILDDCSINTCTCNGGYPTVGSDCAVNGSEDCYSCKGGNSNEYYYYSASGIEGNKCIDCNVPWYGQKKKIYSDRHRITKCCISGEKYNNNTNKCELHRGDADNLCREGEKFNFASGGYCECSNTETYDLTQDLCKDL